MPSVTNVLEEGFALIEKNYTKFLALYLLIFAFALVIVGIALVAMFAIGALAGSANPSTSSNTVLLTIVFFAVFLFAIVFLLEPIWLGTYYSMALQGVKGEISLKYALGQAKEKYWPLLSTLVIEASIFIAIDALIFSPLLLQLPNLWSSINNLNQTSLGYQAVDATAAFYSTLLSFLGLAIVLVIVYMVVTAILAPLLFEAVPLVMIEGTRGISAIKESIDIGEKRYWSILGLIVLFAFVVLAINLGKNILITVVTLLNSILGSVVNIALTVLVSAFVSAWANALPVLFYRDYLSAK